MTSPLDEVKSQIQDHLVSLGNYDAISRQLKLLLYEAGWFDQVLKLVSDELSTSDNFNQVYLAVKPQAEQMVPEDVKKQIMDQIRNYVEEIAN